MAAFTDPTTVALLRSAPRNESSPGTDLAGRIRAIRRDPKHPYNNPRVGTAHQEAVAEMADLYGRLFPNQEGERDVCAR
jgi:hypothetical protein